MKGIKIDASSQKIRTSVTVPIEDYRELERLAQDKKVSVAWVVRDAVDQYLARRSPLLSKN